MKSVSRFILNLSVCLGMCFGMFSSAHAFDLRDPHHDRFLRLALALASSLDSDDSMGKVEARFALLGDSDNCKTTARDSVRKRLVKILRSQPNNKALHQNTQILLRASLRLAEQRWQLGEAELQKLSAKALSDELFGKLMYDLARYFEEGKRYRAVTHLGDGVIRRFGLQELPEKFVTQELARAYFIMGDLEKFLDHGKAFNKAMIDEWAVTAEIRLGRENEGMARQAKLNRDRKVNYTAIAFSKSPAARAEICAEIMKDQKAKPKDEVKYEEVGGRDRVNTNWGPLLCGEFRDVMRLEDKSRWSSQRSTCPRNHWVYNITDHFNSVVACTYEANRLRLAKQPERAEETFQHCVAHTRRALFIDSYSGYSQVHVVLDDDFYFYLKKTYGLNAEAYVVMGIMEEARNDYPAAVKAYNNALTGVAPLAGKWPNQIKEWRDRAQRRADLAAEKAAKEALQN